MFLKKAQTDIPTVEANMNKKVIIVIEKGTYHESFKGGKEYTSVGFMASSYGATGPYDTEEEVKKAIVECKKMITNEGDIPIVENIIETKHLTD